MARYEKGCTSYIFKNEIGNRYGKLTVIERLENNKFNIAMWKCQCDCGQEKITSGHSLRQGHTKSCGCLISEIGISKRNGLAPLKYMYRGTRSGALSRNYEFNLTFEEYEKIVFRKCFYCGTLAKDKHYTHRRNKKKDEFIISNGIDRKDNNKGYTLENSVPCCFDCNRMKSDFSYEYFLEKINEIYNYQRNISENISKHTENN